MYNYLETIPFKRCQDNPEVYQKTLEFQSYLAQNGVAWHNVFANECTIDFSCCEGDGKYNTHLPSYYSFAKQIFDELFQKIKHGDKEHQDWLQNEMNKFLNEVFETT